MDGADELRESEFPYLDASGQAYLDYTGAALPPVSLVRGQERRLTTGAFGNPHSASPASRASTLLLEEAREAVLEFCGTSSDTHVVVFTPNATAAIRLVAESYPFGPGKAFAFCRDNHNSVLGVRRYAARAAAPVATIPLSAELETNEADLTAALDGAAADAGPGLFAYAAQSNATGLRHPLAWVRAAQRRGWRVLLDAAAYLPTGELDLRAVPADFVALSWYKITGFPSGLGCLIARREALDELRRPWFAGGTVHASSAHTDWHLPAPPPDGFEDGTLPFLALPDVTAAVRWHTALGYPAIQRHTAALTQRLLDGLAALRHPDGQKGASVLGGAGRADRRGPTVTFNLLRADGTAIDERVCQDAAAAARVSVRTGCFCNPGVAEQANAMTPAVVRDALSRGTPGDVDEYLRLLHVHAQGAVRASPGVASNETDIDRLLEVCADILARNPPDPATPRTGC